MNFQNILVFGMFFYVNDNMHLSWHGLHKFLQNLMTPVTTLQVSWDKGFNTALPFIVKCTSSENYKLIAKWLNTKQLTEMEPSIERLKHQRQATKEDCCRWHQINETNRCKHTLPKPRDPH